ncbi:MAG: peptidase, partial [Nitrosopumilaceae archaeon]
HEEIHIPKTFGELLVTKYDVTVNGIPLSESFVTIDDYSEEDRIVHVILRPADLLPLLQAVSKTSEMQFAITPSKEVKFPLSANTPNVKYKVDLSWDPPVIRSGENARFFVDITELYKPKIPAPVTYDFAIKQNGNEILRKTISGQLNSQKTNFHDYVFSAKNLGPVVISIENINDPYLSSVDFVTVVNPQEQPTQTFPVLVSSTKITESGTFVSGKYDVDLTWFPSTLAPGAAEFVMTIYDKERGLPVPDAEYDFVLIQNDQEIYRKSGFTKTGGTFEDITFFDRNIGQVILRVENIDGSQEFIEIPISVTPEFPIGSMLALTTIFTSIIILTKFTKSHE